MIQTDDDIIARVLEVEQRKVDRKDDWGGPTDWGITAKGYAEWPGKPYGKTNMDLTLADAVEFYRWLMQSSGVAKITHPLVRWVTFDAVVNHGAKPAIRLLQQALGVHDDGVIGPVTLAAVPYIPEVRLAVRVIAQRVRLFGKIVSHNYTDADHDGKPDAAENCAGWLNRCAAQFEEVVG